MRRRARSLDARLTAAPPLEEIDHTVIGPTLLIGDKALDSTPFFHLRDCMLNLDNGPGKRVVLYGELACYTASWPACGASSWRGDRYYWIEEAMF